MNYSMFDPLPVKLTADGFICLKLSEILFAEIAEPGANGVAGGLLLHAVTNRTLVRYATSFFENPELYEEIKTNIKNHTDRYNNGTTPIHFLYGYGGLGNHLFHQKNATFAPSSGLILVTLGGITYRVEPSSPGIFNGFCQWAAQLK